MKYCSKCKEELPKNAKYCPACGESVVKKKVDTKEIDDIEENKGITIFSYLGPLALIPYFFAKDSKFARYHALQGLNLLFVWVPYVIIYNTFAFLMALNVFSPYGFMGHYSGNNGYVIIMVFLSFVGIVISLFSLMGIIDVIAGKTQELPLVGKIKIIK